VALECVIGKNPINKSHAFGGGLKRMHERFARSTPESFRLLAEHFGCRNVAGLLVAWGVTLFSFCAPGRNGSGWPPSNGVAKLVFGLLLFFLLRLSP
jgi:hypothetical protein